MTDVLSHWFKVLLTTCFVDKANGYLDNKQTVVPLINQTKSLEKLYFVPISSGEFEVGLGTPDLGYESFRQLTYREMLYHYRGVHEPKTLSDFRDIYHDCITPKMLAIKSLIPWITSMTGGELIVRKPKLIII